MIRSFINGFVLICAVALLAGCDDSAPGADLSIVTQAGKKIDFDIELAMTPAQMQKGLMNRTELPKNRGMLFWFGNEEERGFWMKDTLIPLDMLFIRLDGTIHAIKTGQPQDLTSIRSDGPVAAVFEINGGLSEKWGIKPGDTVHFTFFGNALAQ